MHSSKTLILILAALALVACSSDKKPPLKGERISVLQLQNALEVDKDAAQTALELPEAKSNTAWPQQGGNAMHLPGHVALGAAPKKIWSVGIGKGSEKDRKLITAPLVANNHVFVADTNGKVTAFNMTDGKKLWQVDILSKGEDSSTVSPGLSFGDNVLYAVDSVGGVLALNPETGATLWKKQLPHAVLGSPTYQNGRLYVITLSDETIALDGAKGDILWTHTGIEEAAGFLGSPSPAATENVVITLYNSGDVVALRPETGQEAWSDNLSGVLESSGHAVTQLSGFRGHPVIDGDTMIVANAAQRMIDIHIPSGERVWQKEFGLTQTPWVAGNVIFALTAQNEVVAVMKETGQVRWVTALARFKDPDDKDDPIIWSGPVLAGGRLILVNNQGHMLEINPQDGKILHDSEIAGSAMLPPVIAQNTLFLLMDNGTLVAYR